MHACGNQRSLAISSIAFHLNFFFETVSLTDSRACHLDEIGWLACLPKSPNVCLSSAMIIDGQHC